MRDKLLTSANEDLLYFFINEKQNVDCLSTHVNFLIMLNTFQWAKVIGLGVGKTESVHSMS